METCRHGQCCSQQGSIWCAGKAFPAVAPAEPDLRASDRRADPGLVGQLAQAPFQARFPDLRRSIQTHRQQGSAGGFLPPGRPPTGLKPPQPAPKGPGNEETNPKGRGP